MTVAAKGRKGDGERVEDACLRVQGRDTNIFISYRKTDGAKPNTKQLHASLGKRSHRAILDEAIEFVTSPASAGSPVPKQIDDALEKGTWFLLIVPIRALLPWIKHEVDTAELCC